MIHKACMPVYMNSGKIVADGRTGRVDGKIEGSTRGPRGPKKPQNMKVGLYKTAKLQTLAKGKSSKRYF